MRQPRLARSATLTQFGKRPSPGPAPHLVSAPPTLVSPSPPGPAQTHSINAPRQTLPPQSSRPRPQTSDPASRSAPPTRVRPRPPASRVGRCPRSGAEPRWRVTAGSRRERAARAVPGPAVIDRHPAPPGAGWESAMSLLCVGGRGAGRAGEFRGRGLLAWGGVHAGCMRGAVEGVDSYFGARTPSAPRPTPRPVLGWGRGWRLLLGCKEV